MRHRQPVKDAPIQVVRLLNIVVHHPNVWVRGAAHPEIAREGIDIEVRPERAHLRDDFRIGMVNDIVVRLADDVLGDESLLDFGGGFVWLGAESIKRDE